MPAALPSTYVPSFFAYCTQCRFAARVTRNGLSVASLTCSLMLSLLRSQHHVLTHLAFTATCCHVVFCSGAEHPPPPSPSPVTQPRHLCNITAPAQCYIRQLPYGHDGDGHAGHAGAITQFSGCRWGCNTACAAAQGSAPTCHCPGVQPAACCCFSSPTCRCPRLQRRRLLPLKAAACSSPLPPRAACSCFRAATRRCQSQRRGHGGPLSRSRP